MSMPYIDDEIEEDEAVDLLEDFAIEGTDISLDIDAGDIVLADGDVKTVSRLDALRQWINKILMTRAYIYDIYSLENEQTEDDEDEDEDEYASQVYGVSIRDIAMDPDMDYAEKTADIQEDIENALSLHPSILSVDEFEFERNGRTINVTFEVSSIYGDDYEEVSINGEDGE